MLGSGRLNKAKSIRKVEISSYINSGTNNINKEPTRLILRRKLKEGITKNKGSTSPC